MVSDQPRMVKKRLVCDAANRLDDTIYGFAWCSMYYIAVEYILSFEIGMKIPASPQPAVKRLLQHRITANEISQL